MIVTLIALWLGTVAQAACVPVAPASLQTAIDEAVVAFGSMDAGAFGEARGEVQASLPCVTSILTPERAAAVHRLNGLAAYLARDEERTLAAFRGAVALDPMYGLPREIAPQGHKLRIVYETARGFGPGRVGALLPPAGHKIFVDGTESVERSLERPVLVQLQRRGQVVYTGVLHPGETAPDWSKVGITPVLDDVVTGPPPAVKGLVLSTGVAALGTAVLASIALQTQGSAQGLDEDGLRERHQRSRPWWVAGTVGAITTASLGTATVVVTFK